MNIIEKIRARRIERARTDLMTLVPGVSEWTLCQERSGRIFLEPHFGNRDITKQLLTILGIKLKDLTLDAANQTVLEIASIKMKNGSMKVYRIPVIREAQNRFNR